MDATVPVVGSLHSILDFYLRFAIIIFYFIFEIILLSSQRIKTGTVPYNSHCCIPKKINLGESLEQ